MLAAVKYVRFLEALYFMIRLYVGLWQNIGLGIQMIFLHSQHVLVSIWKKTNTCEHKWVQTDHLEETVTYNCFREKFGIFVKGKYINQHWRIFFAMIYFECSYLD